MASDQDKTKSELIAELRQLRREKARLESERQNTASGQKPFRDLFRKSPLGYLSLDEQGCLLDVNTALLEMLGYSQKEVLGRHFSEFVREDWKDRFLDRLSLLETLGEARGEGVEVVGRDGSRITMSVNVHIGPEAGEGSRRIHCVLLDVTERTRLQERLGAKERFLDAILESVQDGVSVIDTNMNVQRMNNVMRQWAGSDGPLEGRKCYEVYHGASQPCSSCCALRCLSSGRTEYEEFPGPPGSSAQWVEVASHPMKHPETGQMEYVVEFVRDVTQRKRAEEALRQSEERFRWAMEASRDGLWDWDLTTDEVYYSPGYAAILGYSREEVPPFASFWKKHLHPEDRETTLRANRDCIENRRESFEIEFRMQTRHGRTRWILGRGMAAARDGNGRATRLVGTHSDITQRKRIEENLRYQKQLLETIINETRDVLAIQHPDNTIERYNQTGYELIGLPPEEVDGSKCFRLLGRDRECRRCAPRLALESGEPARIDKFVPELGAHLDVRSSPVKDAKGNVVRIVNQLRDITEQKSFEERLRAERDYMFQIFDTMSQYIVVESPDYRTQFLNRAAREKFGDLVGSVCYEQLNRTTPCSQCPIPRALAQESPPEPVKYTIEAFGRIMEGNATKLVHQDGSVSVLKVLEDVTEREQAKKALVQSESYYRALFETSGAATAILEQDTTIALANSKFEELTGYSCSEMEGVKSWTDFAHPGDVSWMKAYHYLRRHNPETAPRRYEFRLIDRHGREHDIFLSVGLIAGKGQSVASCIDITERKRAEEALRRSEKYYRAVFETSGSGMFILEKDTTISLVNSHFEKLTGYTRQEVEGRKSWLDFLHPDDIGWTKMYHSMRRRDAGSAPKQYEFRFFDRGGRERIGFLSVDLIPETSKSVISFIDITERKHMENKLKEMSLFDSLTGLYNRAFFEEEMKRLTDVRYSPLSIIVCDINGLKLINDTMGHNKGDELVRDTARILKRCFRASDITSRIGGDEFAVLLPQSGESVVKERVNQIYRDIEQYNRMSSGVGLSVSIGYAVEEEPDQDIKMVFKRADDAMYKDKLQRNHSSRNATIQALIKTLEARDHITDGHAGRLCEHAKQLGTSVGLSGERLSDLQLLARFHDLGKVGIPDSILFKRGRLTEEEFEEMKRHCEIGHRIALATSDLAPIAEYILKHHEWWNGEGYPLGLSGEKIPLECRILSIVDAFDTMTSERPYKAPLSREEAIEELRRCAGTQFDPDLVERFIQTLNELSSERMQA